jgi:hypothetical protein
LTRDPAEKVDTRVLDVLYSLPGDTQSVFVGQQLDVFLQSDAMVKDASAPRRLTRKD